MANSLEILYGKLKEEKTEITLPKVTVINKAYGWASNIPGFIFLKYGTLHTFACHPCTINFMQFSMYMNELQEHCNSVK